MKKLIGKYRSMELTDNELRESRAKASAMSDAELSEAIRSDWNGFEPDERLMDAGAEARVYGRIASKWLGAGRRWAKVWRWVSAAAVIALPVLVFTTIHFQRESSQNYNGLTCFSTGEHETASLQLPDGSTIAMNANSRVEYDIAGFSREQRSVSFSGEGYFKVAKVQGCPFTIGVDCLEVTVRGTEFDLRAYEGKECVWLYLIEGAVAMKAANSADVVELKPNEKAVYDRATGKISVSLIAANDNPTGWKDNKLFFSNAELASVIAHLEEHFGCKIIVDDAVSTERFSGLVPVDNISDAMSVLEKAFNTRLAVVVRE